MLLTILLCLGACRGKDTADTALNGGPGWDSGGEVTSLLCPTEETGDPERLSLWTQDGQDLLAMQADGTTRTLHTFGEDLSPPDGATFTLSLSVNADWIGALGVWTWEEGAGVSQALDEVVVFDRAGARVARTTEAQDSGPTLYLGPDGSVARPRGSQAGLFMDADGQVTVLEGWRPIGRRGTDGWLPACTLDDTQCGWISLEDDPLHLSDHRAAETLMVGGVMVWLSEDHEGGGAALVWDRPDAVNAAPLGTVWPNATFAELVVLHTRVEGRVLVGRQRTGEEAPMLNTLLVADVRNDTTTTVQPALPEDQRPHWQHTCPNPLVQITTDGDLLFVLRDDATAAVWATDTSAQSWTRWGQPVTDLFNIWPVENNGTLQVPASSGDASPCPEVSWAEPDAELEAIPGDSVQIVLHEGAGPSLTLPPPRGPGLWPMEPVMMNGPGTCGMYLDARDGSGEPTILDIQAETEVRLGTDHARWGWLY